MSQNYNFLTFEDIITNFSKMRFNIMSALMHQHGVEANVGKIYKTKLDLQSVNRNQLKRF